MVANRLDYIKHHEDILWLFMQNFGRNIHVDFSTRIGTTMDQQNAETNWNTIDI